MHGLKPPSAPLDLGNSGTSMRLMCGLLAGQGMDVTLVGDASLSRRPMKRVTEASGADGARIDSAEGRYRTTAHQRCRRARRIDYYDMPVASAQVKSCLLLAGMYARGETCVTEPAPTRDHTERMLQGFGYRWCGEGQSGLPEQWRQPAGLRHRRAGGYLLGGVLPGRRQHRARL